MKKVDWKLLEFQLVQNVIGKKNKDTSEWVLMNCKEFYFKSFENCITGIVHN